MYSRAMVKSMNKKRCFKSRKGGTRMSEYQKRVKIELFNDHFENAKRYQIPRAQLIIADIPYNIGKNAYGSRSDWYVGGTIKMENQRKLIVNSLILTRILRSIISSIFVLDY